MKLLTYIGWLVLVFTLGAAPQADSAQDARSIMEQVDARDDGDNQTHQQQEEGDVEAAPVRLELIYYLLQLLVVPLYPVAKSLGLVCSLLGLLMDDVLGLIHLLNFALEPLNSSNDPIQISIHFLIFLLHKLFIR